MTPTDPTRLRQLLTSIKGPLVVRPSTRADGSDCDDVIDKGDGNLNVCEGCDKDRAELIATALNALPSLLVTAEWARKARGVLEQATVEYDNAMAHVTNANYDDAGIHGMDLRAALASLLAPVLSETETGAPDTVQHEVYVAGRTLVTEQPTATAHARAMDWLRAFPGIAGQPGAEQVYEAATLINVVDASITLGTKLPWGEAYSRHIARRRAPALSAVFKGTRGTIEADGENAAELGERLVAEARRIVDDAPTGDAGGGDDGG